jgi:hypothetical protein
MTAGKVLRTGLKILVVCLVFASCFVAGGALSGLNKIGQQAPPAQQALSSEPEAAGQPPAPQTPENLLLTFLFFSVRSRVVLSYLILRSSWHGWALVGAICLGMYGISTVAAQIDSVFFLSNKLPRGMIRALFSSEASPPLCMLLLRFCCWASGVLFRGQRRFLHLPACDPIVRTGHKCRCQENVHRDCRKTSMALLGR